jgi:branched-chain amino acid transport system substrate-binding protein
MLRQRIPAALALCALVYPWAASAQQTIPVGHLADFSGPTSDVGVPYGQGVADAVKHINAKGGVNGKTISIETIDYSYQVPRAIAAYKKWAERDKVVAILGWGTADTEALINFVTKDKLPYISASYAGTLTDPTGKAPKADRAAPYNFFYAPSYSDAARALVQWAAGDWKKQGKAGKPKWVHMGANHPYANAPKAASEEYAKELAFDVLPAIQFALTPGDYTAQCLSLKESGANYAFIANTTTSSVSLLKSCETAGVNVQFLSNVWGMDEAGAKAAGSAANKVVTPVRTSAIWTDNAPGMKLMREISKVSDPDGKLYRPTHYLAAVCTTLYLKEALEWADKNGGIGGENIRKAMYAKKDWVPAGTEGVCRPATWTDKDHRPVMEVAIYRTRVSGPTTGDLNALIAAGTVKLEKIDTVVLPRRPEWLGY